VLWNSHHARSNQRPQAHANRAWSTRAPLSEYECIREEPRGGPSEPHLLQMLFSRSPTPCKGAANPRTTQNRAVDVGEEDAIGAQMSAPAAQNSVLLAWGFFASREDLFGTPQDHCVFSDSVSSPLTSVFSAAGGSRDESSHALWLRPHGCSVSSPLTSVFSAASGSLDERTHLPCSVKPSLC
jgi:hypothetical protein